MENLDENIAKIIKASYPYIKEFNPAQKAVLDSGYIDDKSNYIIAIPTASGKTVLGVLGLLKSLINGSKAIYAVPLVSIQNEKINEFKKFEEFGIKVGRHPNSSDLAVMVFESFDSLTRYNWNVLRDIDSIVIDEFHMIGEDSRGPTIECALTRSRIINPSMRIIALSATLANMDDIKNWLNGKVIEHDYRPLPLKKQVLDNEMFNVKTVGPAHDPSVDAVNLANLYDAVMSNKDTLLDEYKKVLGKFSHFPEPVNKVVQKLVSGESVSPEDFEQEIKKYID